MSAPARRAALVYAGPALGGLALLPLLDFRANRIVGGDGVMAWAATGGSAYATALLAALAVGTILSGSQVLRLALALAALALPLLAGWHRHVLYSPTVAWYIQSIVVVKRMAPLHRRCHLSTPLLPSRSLRCAGVAVLLADLVLHALHACWCAG